MAVVNACDLSETRSVPGLQHGFVQLGRRLERVPFEGVTAKHLIEMKFSTEAIVASALAVLFALLSFGAIVREQGQRPAHDGQDAYIATSHVAANNTNALGLY